MEEDLFTRRRANFAFLLLLAVNLFFLTAHLSDFVHGLKNFISYVLFPSQKAANLVVHSSQGLSRNIKDIVRIHQENLELRKELEKYTFLDREYQQARSENERLRQIVGFTPSPKLRDIAARVVSREPGSWFQWVTINKGAADGLTVDSPVLAWANGRPAVLGRVGEVFDHSSKVVLLTNTLSAVPAKIGAGQEDGLIEGQNGPRLIAGYLSRDSAVAIGDEFLTSPLSTVFPPGILIGQVQDIITSPDDDFRSAVVKTAVNLNELREVMILADKEHE